VSKVDILQEGQCRQVMGLYMGGNDRETES